jgi:hypothetical protein
MQGARTTASDVSGAFRISLVPPGLYRLAVTLPGFSKEERRDVRVALGETTNIPITLIAAATTEVTVSAEVPLVDVVTTKIGTSLPEATLQTLPLGRNYAAAMSTVGGTGSDAAGYTVYGATGLENNYLIEGLNTTSPFLGSQGKELNLEFVQEVEVRTGGYEAEFGRALGGSVNVLTKSGGNEFHGGVFGYYDSGSLAASNQHLEDRNAVSLALPVSPTNDDVGANLGGYFLKDTLWFFGAFDRVASSTDYQRIESLTYTPTGVTNNYVSGTEKARETIFSAKLTLRAGASQTFTASVFGDPSTTDGRTGMIGPASAALIRYEGGGADVVARWDGVFGSRFLAQAQYGHHAEDWSSSTDSPNSVLAVDNRNGLSQALPGSGPGWFGPWHVTRDAWSGSGTVFLGAHELKAGLSYENLRTSGADILSGGGNYTRYLSTAGAFWFSLQHGFAKAPLNCQVLTSGATGNFGWVDPTTCNGWEMTSRVEIDFKARNFALYLQDSSRVLPNLTVNAGIRYEEQQLDDASGAARMNLTNQWSPRVGVVWDPLANGKSKVYGSYGRYYQTIPQQLQYAMGNEYQAYVYNYSQDKLDFVNDGNLAEFAYVIGSDYVPPGIKGMYQDEIVVGGEYEAFRNWSFGIKGIYRGIGRIVEDRCDVYKGSGLGELVPAEAATSCALMNPGEGTFGQLSDPANPDCWADYPANTVPKPCGSVRASRIYRGLELTVKRRLSDRFQLQASYLLSRLVGNYDGFVNQRANQMNPGENVDFDTPANLVNVFGTLALDRTHQIRVNGFYVFPFGLKAGVNASFATGAPQSIFGYYTSEDRHSIYFEPRGSRDRLPSTYQVDLHLEYPIRVGPVAVVPVLDVFNLTDVQTVTKRGEVYNTLATGAPPNPPYTNPTNARFGRDIAWQAPRQVRLGVRAMF